MRLLAILGAIAFCLAPTAVAAQKQRFPVPGLDYGQPCASAAECERAAEIVRREQWWSCRLHCKPRPGVNCRDKCRDVANQSVALLYAKCMREGKTYCLSSLYTCLLDDHAGRPPICCGPGDTAINGRCYGNPYRPADPVLFCQVVQGGVWATYMSDHCQPPCGASNDSYLCEWWQNPYLPNPIADGAFVCCKLDMICKSGYYGINPQTKKPYGAAKDGDWGCRPHP